MPILNVKSNYEKQGEIDAELLLRVFNEKILDVEYDVTKTFINITLSSGFILRVRAHGCYEFSVVIDKGENDEHTISYTK